MYAVSKWKEGAATVCGSSDHSVHDSHTCHNRQSRSPFEVTLKFLLLIVDESGGFMSG